MVQKIKTCEKKQKELSLKWSFPEIQGHKLKQSNSILEFVNYLLHILSLDSKIKEELLYVRRNCLKMLKIDEFAKESEYKEPCIILKM